MLHVLYEAVGTSTAEDSSPSWWLLLRGPVWATVAPEYWFHVNQDCYAIFSLIQHDKLLWGSLYIASAFGLRNKNAYNFYFSLQFGPINICQCIGDVWSRANQGRGTLGELVEQRHPGVHIVTIPVVCITFDARKLLLITAVHLKMDTSWLKLVWVTFNVRFLRSSQIYWESFHYDPSGDITFTLATLWNHNCRC